MPAGRPPGKSKSAKAREQGRTAHGMEGYQGGGYQGGATVPGAMLGLPGHIDFGTAMANGGFGPPGGVPAAFSAGGVPGGFPAGAMHPGAHLPHRHPAPMAMAISSSSSNHYAGTPVQNEGQGSTAMRKLPARRAHVIAAQDEQRRLIQEEQRRIQKEQLRINREKARLAKEKEKRRAAEEGAGGVSGMSRGGSNYSGSNRSSRSSSSTLSTPTDQVSFYGDSWHGSSGVLELEGAHFAPKKRQNRSESEDYEAPSEPSEDESDLSEDFSDNSRKDSDFDSGILSTPPESKSNRVSKTGKRGRPKKGAAPRGKSTVSTAKGKTAQRKGSANSNSIDGFVVEDDDFDDQGNYIGDANANNYNSHMWTGFTSGTGRAAAESGMLEVHNIVCQANITCVEELDLDHVADFLPNIEVVQKKKKQPKKRGRKPKGWVDPRKKEPQTLLALQKAGKTSASWLVKERDVKEGIKQYDEQINDHHSAEIARLEKLTNQATVGSAEGVGNGNADADFDFNFDDTSANASPDKSAKSSNDEFDFADSPGTHGNGPTTSGYGSGYGSPRNSQLTSTNDPASFGLLEGGVCENNPFLHHYLSHTLKFHQTASADWSVYRKIVGTDRAAAAGSSPDEVQKANHLILKVYQERETKDFPLFTTMSSKKKAVSLHIFKNGMLSLQGDLRCGLIEEMKEKTAILEKFEGYVSEAKQKYQRDAGDAATASNKTAEQKSMLLNNKLIPLLLPIPGNEEERTGRSGSGANSPAMKKARYTSPAGRGASSSSDPLPLRKSHFAVSQLSALAKLYLKKLAQTIKQSSPTALKHLRFKNFQIKSLWARMRLGYFVDLEAVADGYQHRKGGAFCQYDPTITTGGGNKAGRGRGNTKSQGSEPGGPSAAKKRAQEIKKYGININKQQEEGVQSYIHSASAVFKNFEECGCQVTLFQSGSCMLIAKDLTALLECQRLLREKIKEYQLAEEDM